MPADVPTRDPEAAVPASADPAPDLERALSAKRKDPPPTTGTRFKAAANLVVAMRRFQSALNPSYTYGKRATSTTSADTGPSAAVKGATPPLDKAASRSAGARTPPPPGVKRFDHHGHKTSLLAAPLPPTPGEAGAGGVSS